MPEIRAAEYRDAPALVRLLAQHGYPTEAGSVERRLGLLLPRTDITVLVAEHDGAVIGVGSLHLLPILYEDVPRGQLTALVVAESARGKGVGQALVRRLEQIAWERGVRRMVVTTANHRARTHQFYERLGYEWTGRRYARALAAPE